MGFYLRVLVLLSLFVLIAFWQLSTFEHILRWDALHCFLTWRFNVASCLEEGVLPLWSAYQYLGFPLHADPETGAWYPLVWLIGFLYGYDFYSINIEWLLHLLIAGFGIFRLSRSMGHKEHIAWIAALSFMGSGIFISNAQNFIYLIGIAWFPLLLCELRLALKTGAALHVASASLVGFLMLTGSYPGITIIAFYCLLAYAVYVILTEKALSWRTFFLAFGAVGIGSGLCAAVHLVSVAEFLPYLSRAEGLSESRILENPFGGKAYISLLTPLAVATRENYDWGSDFSMINGYIGLGALIGIGSLFFQFPMRARQWALMVGGIVLLLIASGVARMWINFLPGMDLFRHPSIFRFFGLLVCILFAADQLNQASKKALERSASVVFVLLIVALLWNRDEWSLHALQRLWVEYLQPTDTSEVTVGARIALQSTFALLLLAAMVWALRSKKMGGLVFLVAVDMAMAVQGNMYSTVVYTAPLAVSQEKFERLPKGPSNYSGALVSGIHSLNDSLQIYGIVQNQNILHKQPAWDGYNSFILKKFDDLQKRPDFQLLMQHPLMYTQNERAVNGFQLLSNSISAEVKAGDATELVLLQNHHPNWACFLNGKPLEVFAFESALMKVKLPSSTQSQKIEWQYNSKAARAALWVSVISILVASIVFIRGLLFRDR
jgi:hypothetical protein